MTPELFATFTTALGTLMDNIGEIVTAILGWGVNVLGFVTSNPLVLIFFIVPLASLAFYTVKSFVR
jgi:hypothetical protein